MGEWLVLSIKDAAEFSSFIGKRHWKPRFTSAHQRHAVGIIHKQFE
jgi:hypothetical protein